MLKLARSVGSKGGSQGCRWNATQLRRCAETLATQRNSTVSQPVPRLPLPCLPLPPLAPLAAWSPRRLAWRCPPPSCLTTPPSRRCAPTSLPHRCPGLWGGGRGGKACIGTCTCQVANQARFTGTGGMACSVSGTQRRDTVHRTYALCISACIRPSPYHLACMPPRPSLSGTLRPRKPPRVCRRARRHGPGGTLHGRRGVCCRRGGAPPLHSGAGRHGGQAWHPGRPAWIRCRLPPRCRRLLAPLNQLGARRWGAAAAHPSAEHVCARQPGFHPARRAQVRWGE